MNYGGWETKNLRHLQESFGSSIKVKADIANFFGSVYSHSIPWAVAGIKAAKQNIGKQHWYNDLDRAVRFCKRNETNGIAVGPGASNIIAEILLSRVDESLKRFSFHRYIDEYTAYCESERHADDFIKSLEGELSKLKLSLNHGKTSYHRMPCPISPSWILEVRRKFQILPEVVRPSNAVDFIDFCLLLAEKELEPNVIKYGFRALATKSLHYWTPSLIVDYGLNIVSRYSSIVPALNPFINIAADRSGRLIFQEKLFAIFDDSLSRGRSDNACWAAYYINLIGSGMADDAIKASVTSLDCLAMCVSFLYASHAQRLVFTKFAERLVSAPDMHDRHQMWILLYELFRTGYLKKVNDDTPAFRTLVGNGVSFIPALR